MKQFFIVFDQSGDCIPVVSLHSDVITYYVQNLNSRHGNKFSATRPYGMQIQSLSQQLMLAVQDINRWMKDLGAHTFPERVLDDYYDQDHLNHIHEIWVKNHNIIYDIDKNIKTQDPLSKQIHDLYPDHIMRPALSDLLGKLGLSGKYNLINDLVHDIEQKFDLFMFQSSAEQWIEFDNPFPKTFLTDDICNVGLTCNHLGRRLVDKWKYWDLDLRYRDENNYDQLLAFIDIGLCPPQKRVPCQQYTDWCRTHGREPIGKNFGLGNILDLDKNLRKFRELITKNLLDNNSFCLQL